VGGAPAHDFSARKAIEQLARGDLNPIKRYKYIKCYKLNRPVDFHGGIEDQA